MRVQGFLAVAILAACASTPADGQAQVRTMGEILEQAPASDWRPIDPANTIYMELEAGRVIIELSPDFSPEHVENLRALARAHYWDGAAITRVQDNYVTQWGRPEGAPDVSLGEARAEIAAHEYYRPARGLPFTGLQDPDSYARQTGFTNGFWAGRDGRNTWMLHCYGAVGVGRDLPPNTGNSAELYTVIGQAPRHLDRNLAMVGRVVRGMELLTALPRGTGDLGFYETPEERTQILRVRLASEVPEAERTNLEALRTDSASFRELIQARRNRTEDFFVDPTGHINVCNVPLPVRDRAQ